MCEEISTIFQKVQIFHHNKGSACCFHYTIVILKFKFSITTRDPACCFHYTIVILNTKFKTKLCCAELYCAAAILQMNKSIVSISIFTSLLLVNLANAAQVAIYVGTSTAACSDPASFLFMITAFSDMCTSSIGTASTLASCSTTKVSVVAYPDSSKDKVNPPACGGNFTSYEATYQCTLVEKNCLGGDCYAILVDSTCSIPTNTYLVSYKASLCSQKPDQTFNTIVADNTCRSILPLSLASTSYIASVGTNSDKINFKLFTKVGCNASYADASWTDVPSTGACIDASPKKIYGSIRVATPAKFALSSALFAIAIGVIIGPIVGGIFCCCGCWGILHACGVVNCPCFNTCCDRRKNIASSGSSPSFPSSSSYGAQPYAQPYGGAQPYAQSYGGAQAPRSSNPYGNVRHV